MTNQPQYPNPPYEGGPKFTEQYNLPAVELIAPPTAWQSIPSPVRFAAWVWAISVIVGVAGAALFAVLFVLGLAAGMSSL